MKNNTDFRIYPAIDLWGGQCVRLRRGCFSAMQFYTKPPLEQALEFKTQGAKFIHVIDLEGAKLRKRVHCELIQKLILQTGLQVQVGGGIRTEEEILELFSQGAARVILGTQALNDHAWLEKMATRFGCERLVLALDFQEDLTLVSEGWTREHPQPFFDTIEQKIEIGFRNFLCSDISKDGMLGGPNLEFYKDLKQNYPEIEIIASGGVSTIRDISLLRNVGASSVVIGKALFENKFTYQEALSA